ncbi:hypothetical protein AN642_00160 [Epulopiscium sp. SCG-B10WGA-EpuloA2]|nr:hypothetical protein AN642_00160 [Epulopiscium sp. SCG-B10WGA-EpuloA2]
MYLYITKLKKEPKHSPTGWALRHIHSFILITQALRALKLDMLAIRKLPYLLEKPLYEYFDAYKTGISKSYPGGPRGCRFSFQPKTPPADFTDYLTFKQRAGTNQ